MTGVAAVDVLELAFPTAAEADEAPHQAYLTDLDGEDLGAGPGGAAGAQDDRGAQPAGQDPGGDQHSPVVGVQQPGSDRGLQRPNGRGGPQPGDLPGMGQLTNF